MFYSIKGELYRKLSDRMLLRTAGGTVYEVLTPETVYHRIEECITNSGVELFIYHYLEMQQNKAFQVLIGFLTELEKDFFESIISVSGIGPKAAVKSLSKPVSEIAAAIENGDVAYLKKLPGIGLQRAKNIVASLQGKMSCFLLLQDKLANVELSSEEVTKELYQEALSVLAQLQYSKKEAAVMIDKALKVNPEIDDLETLLSEIYKQHNPIR